MKRKLVVMTAVLALMLLAALPVGARTERITFSSLETACERAPGESWVSGNVLHVRNDWSRERLVSDNPLGTGTVYILFNANINLNSGRGPAWATYDYFPDGYDGKISGSCTGTVSADPIVGSCIGHGSGELEGLQTRMSLVGIPTPEDHPCLPGPEFGSIRLDWVAFFPGQ